MGWISIFLLPMTEEECEDAKGKRSDIYICSIFVASRQVIGISE